MPSNIGLPLAPFDIIANLRPKRKPTHTATCNNNGDMYAQTESHSGADIVHDVAITRKLARHDIAVLEQEQLKAQLPLSSTNESRQRLPETQDIAAEPTFRAQAEEATIRQLENVAQALRDDEDSLQQPTSTSAALSGPLLHNGQPTGYRQPEETLKTAGYTDGAHQTLSSQDHNMPPTPSFTGLDTDIPRGSFDIPFSPAANGEAASVARLASISGPSKWSNQKRGSGQFFPAGSVRQVDHKIGDSPIAEDEMSRTIRVVPPSEIESAAEDDTDPSIGQSAVKESLYDTRIDSGTGDGTSPPSTQQREWPLTRALDAGQSSHENSSSAKEPAGGTPASEDKRSSRFIRSIYATGGDANTNDTSSNYSSPSKDSEHQGYRTIFNNSAREIREATPDNTRTTTTNLPYRSVSAYSSPGFQKDARERAGGVEDWSDITGDDVDRFGFVRVNPKRASAPLPSTVNAPSSPSRSLAASARSNGSTNSRTNRLQVPGARTSQMSSIRSSNSPASAKGLRSTSGSMRFLHSPRRLAMMDAQSMIPANTSDQDIGHPIDDSQDLSDVRDRGKLQAKREQKWRKMGKRFGGVVAAPGQAFTIIPVHYVFPISDAKLRSRTWKGIPDSMRAEAWWSFLEITTQVPPTSATPRTSEGDLVLRYNHLQEVDFEDDAQIDMDVPRTIGAHICFRRRYRGGQRLLFRLLHALALYFPELGYVQGMAPIAATLLVYFDEERAFVAAVRLWTYRGIAWLYSHGFDQLMEVLDEFKVNWMQKPGTPLYDINKKLESIGVVDMIWATKWYLTLFQYVLPYEAHLRILDVFILHGWAETPMKKPDVEVLHSITAALLLGMREKILAPSAQFEDVMGLLTNKIVLAGSDEGEGGRGMDALMNVARMEFKSRGRH